MALQLQWGLNQTSTDVFAISKAMFQAANTDQVDIFALEACARLGTAIAMSAETCRRIGRLVVPPDDPVPVRFLKATIGYAASDSIVSLGRTDGGLRFLGLATALTTTADHYDSAISIHRMLDKWARDKSLVPSVRLITTLLESIEPRCNRGGFADEVAACQMLLENDPRIGLYPARSVARPLPLSNRPGPAGMEALVDAFRQVHRVGDADVTNVTIQAYSCAPWVIAFAKWCNGESPTVITHQGAVLMGDQRSIVKVILAPPDISKGLQVTVYSSIHGPVSLIDDTYIHKAGGMVTLSTYGELLLRECWLHAKENNSFGWRLLREALPCAIHHVLEDIVVTPDKPTQNEPLAKAQFQNNPQTQLTHAFQGCTSFDGRLCPFPDNHAISTLLSEVFSNRIHADSMSRPESGRPPPSLDPRPLPQDQALSNLPLLKMHLADLKQSCPCWNCSQNTHSLEVCLKTAFYYDFACVVADCLALSLLESPDALLVSRSFGRRYLGEARIFPNAIQRILFEGEISECTTSSVLLWMFDLLGHNEVQGALSDEPWVMSCFKGQAVWPSIYSTQTISKRGYLKMSWLPGKLRYGGDTYSICRGRRVWFDTRDPVDDGPTEQVLQPRNLADHLRLSWQVLTSEKELIVSLGVKDPTGKTSHVQVCPTYIFECLGHALVVEWCCHDQDATLDAPDSFAEYTGPFNVAHIRSRHVFEWRMSTPSEASLEGEQLQSPNYPEASLDTSNEPERLRVVAIDQRRDLRILAVARIGLGYKFVVRGNACLACCIDFCRRHDIPILIL